MGAPRIVSVDETELLSFFEVFPDIRDEGVPWPYNCYTYNLSATNMDLSFTIKPAYKDVRLVLRASTGVAYELDAKSVEDVRYHKEQEVETLEVVLNLRDTLWLTLRPTLRIVHDVQQRI